MPDPFPVRVTPPSKLAAPTPDNIARLEAWLDAITAFGALTGEQPWRFYEALDDYLGPWGESGYLVAYGKKYCALYYNDRALRGSEVGRAWVRRTLLLLQGALKELVLERFRRGTLDALSKEELRAVAFDSHAAAYTEGGLALVVLLSRGLFFRVATIPIREFAPGTGNCVTSWRQVLQTSGSVLPQVLAALFVTRPLSAHGVLARREHAQ